SGTDGVPAFPERGLSLSARARGAERRCQRKRAPSRSLVTGPVQASLRSATHGQNEELPPTKYQRPRLSYALTVPPVAAPTSGNSGGCSLVIFTMPTRNFM